MITPAHVEQAFAKHHVALRSFATAPRLCDRKACSSLWTWGGRSVYLATRDRTDYMVVVFPTPRDAIRGAKVASTPAVRRDNALLLYVRSASARLALVRRIFRSL